MYRSYYYDEPMRVTPQFNITETLRYYQSNTSDNFPSTASITDKAGTNGGVGLTIAETGFNTARGYLSGTISAFADF